jgi:uncharacterized protein
MELAVFIIFVSLGVVVLVLGFIGCFVPVLPGPIVSYLALIFLSIPKKWEVFTPAFLVIMGCVTVGATVIDYILPIVTSKKKGATKAGIWGSVLGMVAGIFFFPPFGMLIGAFAGAVIGELIFNKDRRNALRAGWGIFVGTILSIFIKLGVSGVIALYFFRGIFR